MERITLLYKVKFHKIIIKQEKSRMLSLDGKVIQVYFQEDMKTKAQKRYLQVLSNVPNQRSTLYNIQDRTQSKVPINEDETVCLRVSPSTFNEKIYWTAYERLDEKPAQRTAEKQADKGKNFG